MHGVFFYPFTNKWVGLDDGKRGSARCWPCLAIVGLIEWLWLAEGRLLLFMFFGALIPFSVTWTVLGGAEWRLTLFVYSFYLSRRSGSWTRVMRDTACA